MAPLFFYGTIQVSITISGRGIKKFMKKQLAIHYDPHITEFTYNRKEYKSLKELTVEEIKEKDIIVITTAHTAVDYKIIFKNAKIVFDTRNTPKDKNDNIEKL